MDQKFSELFTKRLEELVADLRFYHKPTGDFVAPTVVETMLPKKEIGHREGEEFPMLCWAITEGKISFRKPQPFEVQIDAVVIVDEGNGSHVEQIARGTASVMELVHAIGGLAANRVLPPYKLQLPFDFHVGDVDHPGKQPHPYYLVQFKLSFLAPN